MENLTVTPYFNNFKNVISDIIGSAEKSIDIAMCWMTSEIMFKALLSVKKKGISVRLLVYHDELNFSNTSLDFDKLADVGVEVRAYIGAGLMHHKYVVIDSKYTITGSLNWTNTGPDQNEENILVVEGGLQNEVAMNYKRNFELLFEKSSPLSKLPLLSKEQDKKRNFFKLLEVETIESDQIGSADFIEDTIHEIEDEILADRSKIKFKKMKLVYGGCTDGKWTYTNKYPLNNFEKELLNKINNDKIVINNGFGELLTAENKKGIKNLVFQIDEFEGVNIEIEWNIDFLELSQISPDVAYYKSLTLLDAFDKDKSLLANTMRNNIYSFYSFDNLVIEHIKKKFKEHKSDLLNNTDKEK
jgi:hypothetical protein